MYSQNQIDQFSSYCFEGKADRVRDLLEQGMDPNTKDSGGITPLIAAIKGGKPEVVACLISYEVDINQGDWTALHELFDLAIDGMIQSKQTRIAPVLLQILPLLIENGGDLNKQNQNGCTPLESLTNYSATEQAFNHLMELFRPVISDIDLRISWDKS